MAEQLLTKCPHCGTTFRLSQQHLQIAGGAVRCGACYQVFHASEYIVKTAVVEEIIPPPPPPPSQQAPLPDPLADFNIDEVGGLDAYNSVDFNLPNAEEELLADDYHKKLMDDVADDTGLNFDNEAATKPTPAQEKAKSPQSEDWAKQLLEELGETFDDDEDDTASDNFSIRKRPAAPAPSNTSFSSISSGADVFNDPSADPGHRKPAGPPNTRTQPSKPRRLEEELSDSFKNLGLKGFSDDPFNIDDLHDVQEKPSSDVDESWAKAMLEELEGDKNSPAITRMDSFAFALEEDEPEEEAPFAARPLSRNKDEAVQKARERNSKLGIVEPKKSSARDDEQEESVISSFDNDFLSDFDEGPLDIEDINLEDAVGAMTEMEDVPEPPPPKMTPAEIAAKVRAHAAQLAMEQAPKRSFFKTFLFSLGSLVLLVTVIAQVGYFKFNELSRWPQLRPLYAIACTKLGCKLPAQTDTSKIRGNNLVVRTHPSIPNALSIDFMISNEARFSQPFPVIELTFEDMDENVVASRGFLPKEYINDPAIDPKNMPPNTPFHIGLEIVDPGPKAANYRLRYLPVPETPTAQVQQSR